jgi:hypothetical protein
MAGDKKGRPKKDQRTHSLKEPKKWREHTWCLQWYHVWLFADLQTCNKLSACQMRSTCVHMRRFNVKGSIKSKWKHNVEVKIECAMRNEDIDGLAINHSLAPLPKQKWMWILDAKEMESSSKIDIRDVSWWMSIKYTCSLVVSITAKLSKEGCISLAAEGRPSHTTRKHDWSRCGPLSTLKTYSFNMGLSKIWNLMHKYKATKTQLLRKIDAA